MKKLIVNADDFGLHPLINAGIIKGYREGFITSTSLMPSAPCWQEAVQLAQENPQLGYRCASDACRQRGTCTSCRQCQQPFG